MDVWERLHNITWLWYVTAAILMLDFLGMVFGWYYYWDVGQFDPASTVYEHWAWWPLVSDSPNAVLVFFVALAAYRFWGWRNKWLDAAAVILNVYVGCWTTLLFINYADQMGTWNWGSTNNVLFFSHLAMPAQAFVLLHRMRDDVITAWQWVALSAAGAFYVFVDYWGPELHPAPFVQDDILTAGSPWLMVIALGTLALFTTGARSRTLEA